MNEAVIALLIPIFAIVGAFIMIVHLRRYENTERLKMIEHGMDPHMQPKRKNFGALKFALIAIGVGIGLLIGNMLDRSGLVYEEVAYFSMAFIFGGAGLLIAYLVESRYIQENDKMGSGHSTGS